MPDGGDHSKKGSCLSAQQANRGSSLFHYKLFRSYSSYSNQTSKIIQDHANKICIHSTWKIKIFTESLQTQRFKHLNKQSTCSCHTAVMLASKTSNISSSMAVPWPSNRAVFAVSCVVGVTVLDHLAAQRPRVLQTCLTVQLLTTC